MKYINILYVEIHGGEISCLPDEAYMGAGFIYIIDGYYNTSGRGVCSHWRSK